MKSKKNAIFVFVSLLLVASLVGCAKPTDAASEEPANTSEVVSEEVSEEPTEEVSEEVSEEGPEIIDGVQMVYFQKFNELYSHVLTLENVVVCCYTFENPEKGQAVLFNGAHYVFEEERNLEVISPTKTISSIVPLYRDIEVLHSILNGDTSWFIYIYAIGTDLEVPLYITYEDGTSEKIVLYITKEWSYSNSLREEVTEAERVPVEIPEIVERPENGVESEIVDGVQKAYFNTYAELSSYVSTLEDAVVCSYNFYAPEMGQAILYDGAHYVLEEGLGLWVESPQKEIGRVISSSNDIFIMSSFDMDDSEQWCVWVNTTGTDIEVPVTIEYEDGTEETITIYVTKEWEDN